MYNIFLVLLFSAAAFCPASRIFGIILFIVRLFFFVLYCTVEVRSTDTILSNTPPTSYFYVLVIFLLYIQTPLFRDYSTTNASCSGKWTRSAFLFRLRTLGFSFRFYYSAHFILAEIYEDP